MSPTESLKSTGNRIFSEVQYLKTLYFALILYLFVSFDSQNKERLLLQTAAGLTNWFL